MVNRKRVWTLACNINDIIEQSLSFRNSRLVDKAATDPDYPTQSDPKRSWQHVEGDVCPLRNYFFRGSRVLFEDLLTLSSPINGVSATYSSMNGKVYISGLQLDQICGETAHFGFRSNMANGYTTTREVTSFELREPFVGFHVAVDARGIRGLRAVGSRGSLLPWIGDHISVPKKIISMSSGGSLHRIRGGFDV